MSEYTEDDIVINPGGSDSLVELRGADGQTVLVIRSLEHGMAIAKVVAQAQRIRPDGKYGILDLGALEEMELALRDMEKLADGH